MQLPVLSQDEFKALSDLSEVLEAAGRVNPIGSDNAWNQEMQRLAKEGATSTLAKLARIARPQDWGRFIEDGRAGTSAVRPIAWSR